MRKALILIAIGAIYRLVPHPWNLVPMVRCRCMPVPASRGGGPGLSPSRRWGFPTW